MLIIYYYYPKDCNFLGFHLLESWSDIETLAGDNILKKNGRVFLGARVSLHMAHDRDVIVAVYLISQTCTAVKGKILLKPCQNCSHTTVWILHVL